jgi:hypothetical protein
VNLCQLKQGVFFASYLSGKSTATPHNCHRRYACKYWIYTYLFAKKDRGNIDTDELAEFKKLAALFSRQTDVTINAQIKNGDLVEICHAKQA